MKKEDQLKLAKEAKAKGKKVKRVTIEGVGLYIEVPDRNIISMGLAASRKSPLGYTEVIITNCYLAGDVPKEKVLEDAALLTALYQVIDEIVGTKEAEVKNF